MEAVMHEIAIDRYPAYKYAGEGWLGEIPAHWEIKKLKLIFTEKKIKHNPELPAGSISFGKVIVKEDEKISESTKASYQEVLSGEFLINPLNLNYDLISLRIGLSYVNVVVSSGYIVINNTIEIDKEYYKFLLHRYDVAYMKLLGSGVRQTISFNHIANSLLPFPPLSEQIAVAEFLNRKTAQIDQAIRIKEKQIELLKERRQILIHQAVTRGLNPDVKMKDSGVEWIGEIPEHWEVKRLKFLTRFVYDGTHGSYPRVENGYRLLSVRNLTDDKFQFKEDDSRVSRKHYEEISQKFKIKEGDIQLAIVGATLGKVAVVNEMEEEFVTQRSLCTIRLNTNSCLPKFAFYYIKSPLFQTYLWNNAGFSAQPGVYLGTVEDGFFTCPPIDEQLETIKYLDKLCDKYEYSISFKLEEIEKLKEYKASLINSAVTGKIKV